MEKRAHILVVDDEQAIADLVVNLLVAEGMDALACYSGQAALDMFARTPFDLAIVDIMMPGIDGFELCVRMRQMRDIPSSSSRRKTRRPTKSSASPWALRGLRHQALPAPRIGGPRESAPTPTPSSAPGFLDPAFAGAIEVDLRTYISHAPRRAFASPPRSSPFWRFWPSRSAHRSRRPICSKGLARALRRRGGQHGHGAHPPPAQEVRRYRRFHDVHRNRLGRRLKLRGAPGDIGHGA